MKSIVVPHTHPFFSKLVGSNNRKEINVDASECVYVSQERSGGSYSSCYRAKLDRPCMGLAVDSGTGFPEFRQGENPVMPGEFFLQTGFFQGKSSRPRIILHPDDFARLCPTGCTLHDECKADPAMAELCPGVNPRQKQILQAFSYVGNYKKESLSRMNARESEIADLERMGLIIKKGSGRGLSIEARNLLK
jgi:hypothetical protein